jgi:hypothetical protein
MNENLETLCIKQNNKNDGMHTKNNVHIHLGKNDVLYIVQNDLTVKKTYRSEHAALD